MAWLIAAAVVFFVAMQSLGPLGALGAAATAVLGLNVGMFAGVIVLGSLVSVEARRASIGLYTNIARVVASVGVVLATYLLLPPALIAVMLGTAVHWAFWLLSDRAH